MEQLGLSKMAHKDGAPEGEIEITPEMIEAGTAFVMNFFPAEWGRRGPIEHSEAEAVASGVLRAAARQCE